MARTKNTRSSRPKPKAGFVSKAARISCDTLPLTSRKVVRANKRLFDEKIHDLRDDPTELERVTSLYRSCLAHGFNCNRSREAVMGIGKTVTLGWVFGNQEEEARISAEASRCKYDSNDSLRLLLTQKQWRECEFIQRNCLPTFIHVERRRRAEGKTPEARCHILTFDRYSK